MRHLLTFFLATIALTAGVAQAREISPDDAIDEVGRFARSRRNSKRGRGPSGEARTYSVDGTNLFHMVALEGGGFVAVAGEDTDNAPSILGFSESGEFSELDVNSPLWALLCGDTAKRRGMNPRHAMRKKPHVKKHNKPRKKNSLLLASSSTTLLAASADPVTNDSMITDMRVPPLVKSKWDQSKVGGKNVYNYYTPNKYYCGCVATAMAQLMRYHEYPRTAVNANTNTCYVSGVATNMTMMGGKYDWDNMPLDPDSSISDEERMEIGKICYDAGVAMRMKYASGASSAITAFAHISLKDVFKYANAESYVKVEGDTIETIDEDAIQKAILANLDAQFPVLLDIQGVQEDDGHAIVADGYGYVNGTRYVHLNMGWSGIDDYWYVIPEINPPYNNKFSFTWIQSVVYNIFPDRKGQLLTGRVVDEKGNALSNATVTAKYSGITTNVATSAYGIYSFLIDFENEVEKSVSVCANYGYGCSAKTNIVKLTASSSPVKVDYKTGGFSYNGELSVGNSWGNDLTVIPAQGEAAYISTFSLPDAGAVGYANITFSGTAGARYQLEWTDALTNQVWNVYTNILLNVNGADTIPIMLDPASPSRFYRLSTSTWK